jgi:hypothetical protein
VVPVDRRGAIPPADAEFLKNIKKIKNIFSYMALFLAAISQKMAKKPG